MVNQTNRILLGDIVQLKSGGPKMIACEVKSPVRVRCMWIEDREYVADTFHPGLLTTVKPDPTPASALHENTAE